ncbi:MAG: rhodanese-like domain-containing protein [Methylococcaceae bacterium]|jgi:rhodanese-related sulfurtransferase|nr:MAG: rhodanese-like domain-containing protein [Methylococcaceae bacterium]
MNNLSTLLAVFLFFATPVAFAASNTSDHVKKPEAASAEQARPYTAKTPKLDRAQLEAWLLKPEQVLLIDVRRPQEIADIGGFSTYLSIQMATLENSVAFIPKDRVIITISNHANRAGKAADFLASKGFKVGGAVGAQYYEQQGGTLIKVLPPTPKPTLEHKS